MGEYLAHLEDNPRLVAGHWVFIISFAERLAPAYAATADESLLILTEAMMAVRNNAMWAEGIFLGVAVVLLSLGQIRSTALPRWPGYVGLLGGTLEIAGGLGSLITILHYIGKAGGSLITTVWVLSTGIVMLRQSVRKRRADPADSA